MNNEGTKALALASADYLISGQLTLLRLTGKEDNPTLSIPTADGIDEEDLKQILSDKFSSDLYTFEFEYIPSSAANGTTIIHINKINS